MKKYLLDTNICMHFLRGKFDLDEKIREAGLEHCFLSEITIAELEYGVENCALEYQALQRAALERFAVAFADRILPIRPCFSLYAKNRARLRQSGMPISDFDLLIGCTALANGLIIVTENTSEFTRIESLLVENWVKRAS